MFPGSYSRVVVNSEFQIAAIRVHVTFHSTKNSLLHFQKLSVADGTGTALSGIWENWDNLGRYFLIFENFLEGGKSGVPITRASR